MTPRARPPGAELIPAACYCRFSSDEQNPRSLDDQERMVRAWAAANGYTIAEHIFSDAGVSGARTDREGLQRMLALATGKRPPFRAILVDDLSRLSRDQWALGGILGALAQAGVRVVDASSGTASDAEGGRAMFAVKGLVADQFLEG